jgi:hypothetical protein
MAVQMPARPVGPQYQFWRRQQVSHDGIPRYSSPIYVLDTLSGNAYWYSEIGEFSCMSGLTRAVMENQGGVRLEYSPWDDRPEMRLPEGF